jgi:hypothetical protein
LIAKLDNALELVPMWRSLVFPIAVSNASIFIWEVRYAFFSTKSSATIEKVIASRLQVSSETVTGSMYLEKVGLLVSLVNKGLKEV